MSRRTSTRVGLLILAATLTIPGIAGGQEPQDPESAVATALRLLLDDRPGAQDLSRPVELQPFSSYGNQPEIPSTPIHMSSVITTTIPFGEVPATSSFNELIDRLLAGAGIECGQNGAGKPLVLCPPPSLSESIGRELLLLGGEVNGGNLIGGLSDSKINLDISLFDPARPRFPADPQFPNDYYQGMNTFLNTEWNGTQWGPLRYGTFNGDPSQAFDEAPPPAVGFIADDTFMFILKPPPNVQSLRITTFRTLVSKPFDPSAVVATSYPSATTEFEAELIEDIFVSLLEEFEAEDEEDLEAAFRLLGLPPLVWVIAGILAALLAGGLFWYLRSRSTPTRTQSEGPSIAGPQGSPPVDTEQDRVRDGSVEYWDSGWRDFEGRDEDEQTPAPKAEGGGALGGIMEGFVGIGSERSGEEKRDTPIGNTAGLKPDPAVEGRTLQTETNDLQDDSSEDLDDSWTYTIRDDAARLWSKPQAQERQEGEGTDADEKAGPTAEVGVPPSAEEGGALGGILEGFAGIGTEHPPEAADVDDKAGDHQPPAEGESGEPSRAEGSQSGPGDARRD